MINNLKGKSFTISGLGVYTPDEVRTNDFWPPEIVEQWGKGKKTNFLHLKNDESSSKESLHPILQSELKKYNNDPFVGMKERRVSKIAPSEMELIACRQALEDAGTKPEEIDLFLGYSMPADYFIMPNVFKLNYELGLTNAKTFEVNSLCNSFLVMLDIASQYIRNGMADKVLIAGSFTASSYYDYTTSISPMGGDGAAAAVLSSCDADYGLQFLHLKVEPKYYKNLRTVRRPPSIIKLPESDYAESQSSEKLYFTNAEPALTREMVSRVPIWTEELRNELFIKNDIHAEDIDLVAPHGATVWYSDVVSRILEISIEKFEDNVLKHSNIGVALIPTNLHYAYKKGRLQNGDNVLLLGHGAGGSYGGAVLRWYK